MGFKQTLAAAAGAILISGALLTGAAFAAGSAEEPARQGVHASQLTPGETETLKKLGELRRSYRDRYRADARGIVEQAVKDGKLTREQAVRMLQEGAHIQHGKGPFHDMTREEVKAKLDAAVRSGKMTQEKADEIFQRWSERHSQAR